MAMLSEKSINGISHIELAGIWCVLCMHGCEEAMACPPVSLPPCFKLLLQAA